jgi:hypothetical protein
VVYVRWEAVKPGSWEAVGLEAIKPGGPDFSIEMADPPSIAELKAIESLDATGLLFQLNTYEKELGAV